MSATGVFAQGITLPGGSGAGGGGTIDEPLDVSFGGDELILYATGDPSVPFGVPIVVIDPDGTPTTASSVNYHDNAPLVSQDGPVMLCKGWSGAPTALTFYTNLTMVNCTPEGEVRVAISNNGVELLPAGAALADNTANPTLTKIATFTHIYDGSTWDRWTGILTAANYLPVIACNQVYTGAPSADAIVIALSGSLTTYICSIHIDAEGTVDTRIISGTGSTCGTSTTQMSPLYAFSTTTGFLGGNEGSGLGMIMKSDAGEDVCVDVSGAVVNNIRITYAQF